MNDGVLHDEIIYREHVITVHELRDSNVVLYYASLIELGYVSVSYDLDFCIHKAIQRIDMEYDYNEG
jgi:hypothetical protein